MNTLIIAEKPSVALRLAMALGNGKQEQKHTTERVSYFEIKNGADVLYIAPAVGHLFTIKQKDSTRGYPVLEVEWAPSHAVSSFSEYTKKYLDALVAIGKKCSRFINACDYDIEGTVIGTNIIRFLHKGQLKEDAKRMKFSTTTTEDLLDAYKHLTSLDMDNFYAGEVRHMLDWLWGINLSRALTQALTGRTFGGKSLSIGRVQGPTLAMLAKHEISIEKFVPKPFWRITAIINEVEFSNLKGDIFDKEAARSSYEKTKQSSSKGMIESVDATERKVNPYPPFDLTSLQVEASRALRIDPSRTLAIAQSLYEKSYISYPRTSSQKLPPTLGLQRVISDISKNPTYEKLAKILIKGKRFVPKEGAKTDEAHPAIYPTGVLPVGMNEEEARIYDIITKRFLGCFADAATVARLRVVADFNGEKYSANGAKITDKGWLEFYDYTQLEEKELPTFQKGARVPASKVDMKEMQTQPPKRYSKATLIYELEKMNLGTKATRASIIDTLFKRNYIEGTSIKVTKFGMSVYDALEKNCKMIVDESTTRTLEEDMENITKHKKTEEEVLQEGKDMLIEALKTFDAHKEQIAVAMRKAQYETEIIGKCPKDGGNLVIRKSRVGKNFIACANYPKCTNTYSVPQGALILPTGKTCEHCHTPIIKVIRKGRRPFEMDLDPTCVTKKDWEPFAQASKVVKSVVEVQKPEKENTAQKPKKEKRTKVKAVKKVVPKKRKKRVTADEGFE
ncbi:MAG TPA: DNA topoisomerase I [Candidatus Acidoferrum sp.]|nr:DNA topoisomerase I [Candidatus Acidoferrum sp.]